MSDERYRQTLEMRDKAGYALHHMAEARSHLEALTTLNRSSIAHGLWSEVERHLTAARDLAGQAKATCPETFGSAPTAKSASQAARRV